MRVKFETSKRQYSESFVKQKQKYEKTFKMIIADKKNDNAGQNILHDNYDPNDN